MLIQERFLNVSPFSRPSIETCTKKSRLNRINKTSRDSFYFLYKLKKYFAGGSKRGDPESQVLTVKNEKKSVCQHHVVISLVQSLVHARV